MKKILMGAAALLFAGVLAGCNQLTQYTLSEQEVNDYLQKHNDYQKQIGVRHGGRQHRADSAAKPDRPQRAG